MGAGVGDLGEALIHRDGGNNLPCQHRVTKPGTEAIQRFKTLAWRLAGKPRGHPLLGPGKELEHCAGDNPQGPFCAHEQMFEVVTGVVLPQAIQAVPNTPIGEHHFQPKHKITHVAVANDVNAACVRGQVSANPAGAFRAQ